MKKFNEKVIFNIIKKSTFSSDFSETILSYIKKRITYFGGKYSQDVEKTDLKEHIFVNIDLDSPLLDIDLIQSAIQYSYDNTLHKITLNTATPGTSPLSIVNTSNLNQKSADFNPVSYKRVNHNFDLKKNKRLKCFLYLLEKYSDTLYKISIGQLCNLCKVEHSSFLAYCTGEKLIKNNVCPYCKSVNFSPLYSKESSPLIGYLSPEIPIYNLCAECGLGYVTEEFPSDKVHLLYDKFDYLDNKNVPTFSSSFLNAREERALNLVETKLKSSPKCLDLGGGTGRFSMGCKKRHQHWEITHSDFDSRQNTDLKKANINSKVLNFLKNSIGNEEFDLITAFEVIEHIPFKGVPGFFENVYNALNAGGFFLLTTPDLDSYLTKCYDFYSVYAPHHFTIYGKTWLERYIRQETQFSLCAIDHASDLIDNRFMEYYKSTNNSFQSRSSAALLELLLSNNPSNYDLLLKNGHGTEVIFLLKKDH